MQPELEQLLILQDREQKIRQLRAEAKTVPQQRAQLETQLATAEAALEKLRHSAKQVELEKKRLELDVGTRTESINRLRTQQYETRKNEEFRAIGNEIERYGKEIQALEDQELELMEQADRLREQITAEEKTAAQAREAAARQMANLEDKGREIEKRLHDLATERAEIAEKIDEDLVEKFERLMTSKGDAAIVGLVHEVCTGCHMKITTQTSHRVKSGREIVNCEQCGRILYWED